MNAECGFVGILSDIPPVLNEKTYSTMLPNILGDILCEKNKPTIRY